MYRRVTFLFSVLSLLLLDFPTPTAASVDCSPYEVYSIDSVFQIDGWLLIEVSHVSYTCEMIAGEWENRVDTANFYLILTDGSRAFLIGGSGPPLDWTMPAGFLNGTLYAARISKSKEPYKNITVTIDGEPKNFTLIKNVTVREIYRFEGDCLEKVSECILTTYPNGTVTKRCNGAQLNVSAFKLPSTQTYGSCVEARDGRLAFTLEEKDYTAALPENIHASKLSLTAFKAKRGIVLINRRLTQLPAGEGLGEAPLLFGIENGTVFRLEVPSDFSELVCEKPVVSDTNTTAEPNEPSATGIKICGPGFILLAAPIPVLLRRAKR